MAQQRSIAGADATAYVAVERTFAQPVIDVERDVGLSPTNNVAPAMFYGRLSLVNQGVLWLLTSQAPTKELNLGGG